MPKRNTKNALMHPLYRNASIYNRNEVIYTCIRFKGKQYRQTTNLTWCPENIKYALNILEKRYFDLMEPGQNKQDIQSLFNSFIILKTKSISFEAIKKYRQSWNSWIKKSYTTDETDLIRNDIIELVNTSKLNPNTIRKSLQLLSAFFNYLVENKFIENNPVTNSMMPKAKKLNPEQYTANEVKTLINHFKDGSEMNLIVRLVSLTGMRISEVTDLKKGDIYADHIRVTGKGNVIRVIPILENSELENLCNILKERPKPTKYLISDYPHELFKKACEKLKIRNLGFHGIRKFYENSLINSGLDIKTVAQILGHTVAVQSKHYVTANSLNKLTKAMSALQNEHK